MHFQSEVYRYLFWVVLLWCHTFDVMSYHMFPHYHIQINAPVWIIFIFILNQTGCYYQCHFLNHM